MRAVVPRFRPGWKMVSKDAEYAYLGAKLVMTQTRFPVPYKDPQVRHRRHRTGHSQRTSNACTHSSRAALRSACAVQVWCPSEEGEWKGLSKGRAVRSMQFKVKLQRDIRKRNKHLKVS